MITRFRACLAMGSATVAVIAALSVGAASASATDSCSSFSTTPQPSSSVIEATWSIKCNFYVMGFYELYRESSPGVWTFSSCGTTGCGESRGYYDAGTSHNQVTDGYLGFYPNATNYCAWNWRIDAVAWDSGFNVEDSYTSVSKTC